MNNTASQQTSLAADATPITVALKEKLAHRLFVLAQPYVKGGDVSGWDYEYKREHDRWLGEANEILALVATERAQDDVELYSRLREGIATAFRLNNIGAPRAASTALIGAWVALQRGEHCACGECEECIVRAGLASAQSNESAQAGQNA